jgi:two-component system, OmpR family, response regulator
MNKFARTTAKPSPSPRSKPPRLLVVDDDSGVRELLYNYLQNAGYVVVTVADGQAMRQELATNPTVDAIVLDLMLPGEDGLAICKSVRLTSSIPILMLTARDEPFDRVLGLELGADDYLCKPFEPRELLARIRAILRRAGEADTGKSVAERSQIKFAGWRLDLRMHCLFDPANAMVTLSTGEYRLLRALAENIDRVLSRDHLIDALSGRSAMPFDRSVDVLIGRLRRRLRDDAREPRLIKTIRSEGYMLRSHALTEEP